MNPLYWGAWLLLSVALLFVATEIPRCLARRRINKAAERRAAEKAEAARPDLQWLKTHRKEPPDPTTERN